MLGHRWLGIVILTLFTVSFFGIGAAARAQGEATPVANPADWGKTCQIEKGSIEPIHLKAGQEAITTFDDSCTPHTVIQPISGPEPEEGDGYTSGRSESPQGFTGGSPAQVDPLARFSSYSSVCHASSRIEDPVGISLTHSEVITKWYYNFSINTGRSFSDSYTYHSEFSYDGWHVVDGPWFYWYTLATPVGAEGWTEFAWNFGTYDHELRAIPWMDQYGGCSADFYVSGDLADAFSYHTRVYVNGQ